MLIVNSIQCVLHKKYFYKCSLGINLLSLKLFKIFIKFVKKKEKKTRKQMVFKNNKLTKNIYIYIKYTDIKKKDFINLTESII